MINLKTAVISLVAVLFFSSCTTEKNASEIANYSYTPDSQELYDKIVLLDSIYFNAYNTCDLDKQSEMYSDDLEFYHDQGGLMTSKTDLIEALKNNICGKVTRELVNGSIEVYPIGDYGAVEIGLHKFHNNTEPEGTPSKVGKFIMIWQNENNNWKITRVISLH